MNGISTGTAGVVGIALMIVGCIAIIGGVVGALVAMVKELRRTPSAASEGGFLEGLAKVITAVTEFIKALVTSPVWLALVVIGALLVGFGWWMSFGGST